MINKLLIANRGEIVVRIDRACRKLGIETATVHSAADRNSVHVRTVGESIEIGGAPANQSYLNIEAVIDAAKQVGADAIHPGIGFLSEDPAFAEAVEREGLLFIGPSPDLLRRFGDKWSAKKEARNAGVAVIGGGDGSSDDPKEVERLIREELSLPVVLKAAAGGGGRGVRIVRQLEGLSESIESAMREALSSFGKPHLIVEQFVESARHIEVQVAGDGKGNAIHLFERECSLQRRFQKIVEEAPARLSDDVRNRVLNDAVSLAKSVKYKNLGTVEFLVSGDKHYFLECNPRLQVEHTVTEEITGRDLVALQLHIANESALPFEQDDIVSKGHSIQLRIYAEDSRKGFVPSTGKLTAVQFPQNRRIETGVETGSVITPFYDSMIAKLISTGSDRESALNLSRSALDDTFISGVETNIGFLKRLLNDPVVKTGLPDNRYIDSHLDELNVELSPSEEVGAIAAAISVQSQELTPKLGLWSTTGSLSGWSFSLGGKVDGPPAFSLEGVDGEQWQIVLGLNVKGGKRVIRVNDTTFELELEALPNGQWIVGCGNRTVTVAASVADNLVSVRGALGSFDFVKSAYLQLDSAASVQEGMAVAPMMGTIAKVLVAEGDIVKKGDVLVIEESMKMELSVSATIDGTVVSIFCAEKDIVERNQVLVEISAD